MLIPFPLPASLVVRFHSPRFSLRFSRILQNPFQRDLSYLPLCEILAGNGLFLTFNSENGMRFDDFSSRLGEARKINREDEKNVIVNAGSAEPRPRVRDVHGRVTRRKTRSAAMRGWEKRSGLAFRQPRELTPRDVYGYTLVQIYVQQARNGFVSGERIYLAPDSAIIARSGAGTRKRKKRGRETDSIEIELTRCSFIAINKAISLSLFLSLSRALYLYFPCGEEKNSHTYARTRAAELISG